jgi:hypothetical protein
MKGNTTMKRTAIVTAAALMFTGMTTLSIASENAVQGKSSAPVVQGKSEVSPAPIMEKKNEILPGAEHSAPPQKVEKVVQNSAPVSEKSMTEKKETPASATTGTEVKDKKVEQKLQEAQPATTPAK